LKVKSVVARIVMRSVMQRPRFLWEQVPVWEPQIIEASGEMQGVDGDDQSGEEPGGNALLLADMLGSVRELPPLEKVIGLETKE